ncbi:MAG: hypothetical protein HY319_01670 [Armatimonadetes bacterium]|nr:hypothetical protein [Armatimonadota bacterium]
MHALAARTMVPPALARTLPRVSAAPQPESSEPSADIFKPSAAEVDSSQSAPAGSSSIWRTGSLALLGLAGLAGGLALTATPAEAQSVGIYVGPNSVGVHVDAGHRHHPRGPWHRPAPRPGWGWGHQQQDWRYTHGPYYSGWGADGVVHQFDRFGHVNDASGHYQLRVDGWGNIYRDYNVNFPGW